VRAFAHVLPVRAFANVLVRIRELATVGLPSCGQHQAWTGTWVGNCKSRKEDG
jgi:hypothetical protein